MAFEGPIEGFPEYQKTREELLTRARQLGWYHTLQLDAGLRTAGEFDLDDYVRYYLPFDDLKAFRCLEIGSGNGFWSFEMEKRQAASITALDIPDFFETDFSKRFGRDGERPAGRSSPGAFGEQLRIAAVLRQSKLHYRLGSVYDVRPETHGRFDLVFCGSMLMHLFGPMIALQAIASVCDDACLITTQTDLTLEPLAAMSYLGHEIPFVHFVPSPTCLHAMLTSCGYEKVLRGPTFFLRFRDRANPMTIPHTSFIGLKSVSKTALSLPAPGLVSADAARADIDVVSAPTHVAPGEQFEILARVRNASQKPWLSADPNSPITLQVESTHGERMSAPIADFLPAGLDTLVPIACLAPISEGQMTLTLSVSQGSTTFQSGHHTVSVVVGSSTRRRAVVERMRAVVAQLRRRR